HVTGVQTCALPICKKTIVDYLCKYGRNVGIVVMDMNWSFKEAVKKVLDRPIIVADHFHFCRYIYQALDKVRIRIQDTFNDYDRKRCKKMRHIFQQSVKRKTVVVFKSLPEYVRGIRISILPKRRVLSLV